MKNLIRKFINNPVQIWAASLIILLSVIVTPIAITGCVGTPNSIAYKTTGIAVTTVDGAMNGWGDYVRAGKATPDDQKRVRAAYDKYVAALNVERDIIRAAKGHPDADALTIAEQALATAGTDLISLVQSFLTKGTK